MRLFIVLQILLTYLTVEVDAQGTYKSSENGGWQDVSWIDEESNVAEVPDVSFQYGQNVKILHEITSDQDVLIADTHPLASLFIMPGGKLELINYGKLSMVKASRLDVKQGGELILGILETENSAAENSSLEITISGTLRANKVILKNNSDIEMEFEGNGNLFIDTLIFEGSAEGKATVFGYSYDDLGGDGGPIYGVEITDGALPIELASFSAKQVTSNTVQINWTSLSETNNEYFVVEKSSDLLQWEQVEIVPGAGNAYEPIDYEVIDYNSAASELYYRLCQYDFDGASECFDVVSVEKAKQSDFAIYPNPASIGQPVTIEGNPQTIAVFNTSGQNVSAKIQDNQIQDLRSGTYFVSLNGEMHKLIILD
jgi:hypothetical protein